MKMNKVEKSWVLYDVANSAFTMLVSTTIPIYFSGIAEAAGKDGVEVTQIWSLATSVAVLIMALLSPILGAIADYKGMRKKLFGISLAFGLVGAVSLAVVTDWMGYLLVFILARLGYTAANVFYDSMLTDVTTDERMNMVSSHGYAWGYIGSCIPFILGIALIFLKPFGLSTAQATQLSFLLTAIWWLVMSIPLLKNVKQVHYLEKQPHLIRDTFRRVWATMKKIKNNKPLFYYIIAYFCYIDGVFTIISLSTTYGNELGIPSEQMILALLLTQFVAFPCAILSGKLAAKYGCLRLIKVFVIMYMGICAFGFQLDKVWEFWFLAVCVGICQGGIQSLSRSYYGKLVPKEESSEYFGFFDIFGKFADFMGPLIVAASAALFNTSTYGILALLVLFLIGYLLLRKVPVDQAN